MPLTLIDGYEHAIAAASLPDVTDTGSPTYDTTVKRSGLRSLKCTSAASSVARSYTLPGGTRVVVARVGFYTPAKPTGGGYFLASATGAGTAMRVRIDPAGDMYAQVAGGVSETYAGTLTFGAWHTLDVRFTMSAGTGTGLATIDWRIDGAAQPQASLSTATRGDITALVIGNTNTLVTGTVYYDDLLVSLTTGDYPLANANVEHLTPSADGAHAVGAGAFQTDAGTAITNATTTVHTLVDELPIGVGSDYVAQTAIDANGYVEVALTDATRAKQPLAVMARAAIAASGTGANTWAVRLRDDAGDQDVYEATASGLPGGVTAYVAQQLMLTASGAAAWTVAKLNALRVRFGYGGDVTPNPRLAGVHVEVAYGAADDTSGGGPPPDPDPEPTTGLHGVPNTAGWFAMACTGNQINDKLSNYTTAEVEELGRRLQLYQTNPTAGAVSGSRSYPHMATLKTANPTIKCTLYQKSIQVKKAQFDVIPKAWLAKNAAGAYLYNDTFFVYVADPHITTPQYQGANGWYDWFIPQVVADINAENDLYASSNPIDGVMGDSMGSYMYTLDGGPAKPGAGRNYFKSEWYPKVWDYATLIRQQRPGTFVIHNGAVAGVDGTAPAQAHKPTCVMNEGFCLSAKNIPTLGRQADSVFRTDVQQVKDTQAKGTVFWCLVETTSTMTATRRNQVRDYTSAAYMLGNDVGALFDFHVDGMNYADQLVELRRPLYTARLGRPSETRAVSAYRVSGSDADGGLYVRKFANGAALVNTSATARTWAGDGRTYFAVGGAVIGRAITVQPGFGEIVLTEDAPEPGTVPTNTGQPQVTPAPDAERGSDDLVCSDGSWNGAPDSYAKQWRRNGANISGQTGDSLAATVHAAYADGDVITCAVTATNAAGSSTPAVSTGTTLKTTPGPGGGEYTSREHLPMPTAGLSYLGEAVNQESRTYTRTTMLARESALGRILRVNVHDYNLTAPTTLPEVDDDLQRGRLPLLRIGGLNDDTGLSDWPGAAAILAGTWDAQLDAWGSLLAGIGVPVLVEPWRRPNVSGQPWSGMTTADFIAIWTRLRDALVAADAGNAYLVWSPDVTAGVAAGGWYPGNALVDVIGGYATFTAPYGTLAARFGTWWSTHGPAARGKPTIMHIDAATGAARDTWFASLVGELGSAFNDVDAVVFANEPSNSLGSPAGDAAAYLAMANSSRFAFPPVAVTAADDYIEWQDTVTPSSTWATEARIGSWLVGQPIGQGAQPLPRVLIDPSTDPNGTDEAVWQDITHRVRELSTSRGRRDEMSRFDPATAELLLDNRDGYFDPFFLPSPLYGKLRPMRRARVQWQWGGATRGLVTGYLDSLHPRWPGGGKDDVVVARIVGTMTALALDQYTETDALDAELSGERVARVLAQAGVPGNVQPGRSTVRGGQVDENALSYAQAVAESEQGQLFDDRNGRVAFKGRHDRLANRRLVEAALGDNDYAGLDPDYDVTLVVNEVAVKGAEGDAVQLAVDDVSRRRYFPRRVDVDSLLDDEQERLDLARYLLAKRAEPVVRYPSITIRGRTQVWHLLLALDIGSRIQLTRTVTRTGQAPQAYVLDHHVEGIVHHATPGAPTLWETTLSISPAEPQAFWVLGDPFLGRLGISTRLAY